MNWVAIGIELGCALLTVCGIVYGLLVLMAVRGFARAPLQGAAFAPPVSVLKPVKGVDARMHAGLVSHCQQVYPSGFEIVFGVSSLEDAAVAEIARLKVDFPNVTIVLVECRERLGSNGKVSNLTQMLPVANFEYVVVNDSDILVAPGYLQAVMRPFSDASVGLVTAPYVGQAEKTLWSKLEALGIATDFMPGVLVARKLENGVHFGLGSTLATTKTALASIGGFKALVDQLADDYEMGARLANAGYKVQLAKEVVQTTVPAYTLRGFCEHQLRWARSTRDSRRGGYVGLGVTYALPWAMATVLASGVALWSVTLLSLALLVRVACALSVGVGLLRDEQVLRDLWLLPLRDCAGLGFWAWSYAGDTIVWRGERFFLRRGKLVRA
jgi:ceramide glucosyltransferase